MDHMDQGYHLLRYLYLNLVMSPTVTRTETRTEP